MTTPIKAKRKLSNIDFSGDNAHIALVTASQGGPANGAAYKLIMKAEGTTPEMLEKMQAVKVTLDTPDFLEQFFSMTEWDAELLAAILGYKDTDDATAEGDMQDWVSQYVAEMLPSFEVMKSVHESGDIPAAVAMLTAEERLQFLKDQSIVEKMFRKKSRLEKKQVQAQKAETVKTEKAAKETSTAVPIENMENKNMATENKSEVVDVSKALEDTKVELEKALARVADFEKSQKEAIVKAKTSKIQEITKAAAELKDTEILVKAGLALDEADYLKYTAELTSMVAMIEKSALFKETGVTTDPVDTAPKNGVLNAVKALVAKQNK